MIIRWILCVALNLALCSATTFAQSFHTRGVLFPPLPNDTILSFKVQVDGPFEGGPDTIRFQACCSSTVAPNIIIDPVFPLDINVTYDTHGLSCIQWPDVVTLWGPGNQYLNAYNYGSVGCYDPALSSNFVVYDSVLHLVCEAGQGAVAKLPVGMDTNAKPIKLRVSDMHSPFSAVFDSSFLGDSVFYPICQGLPVYFSPSRPGHYTDTILLHNDDSHSVYRIVLVGDASDASVKEGQAIAPHLFPNPATGHVSFDPGNRAPFTLSFIDYLGREVLHTGELSGTSQIDIRSLRTGIYYVRCTLSGNGGTSVNARLVVTGE